MVNPRRRKGMSVTRHTRALQALNLRKQGHNYETIAQQLNVSLSTAYQDVQKALQETLQEPSEEVRKLELERLDHQYLTLNQQLTNLLNQQHTTTIDKLITALTRIITSQLSIQDRRAKYLGLDTPQTNTTTTTTAEEIHKTLTNLINTNETTLIKQIQQTEHTT